MACLTGLPVDLLVMLEALVRGLEQDLARCLCSIQLWGASSLHCQKYVSLNI